jgi:selenocysteine-specific elongation factor
MTQLKQQYIIGMAGHIDHGKTALVKALTGIDTDRLKEEKERGITIDLGFAHLSENVTIIDVPGHERLIKNMVAGVSTIDLVLFVIAADDGIMPQTREHLDIVQLLGIHNGIFVLTKIDLADEDWINLVEADIRNLLQGSVFADSPIIRTSTLTGHGIAEVQKKLSEKLSRLTVRKNDGIFRLPVDRVFSKTGFGSVVTGSVISGAAQTGEVIEILPEKISARIRGLQSHDSLTQRVDTGFRAAINLAGVELQNLYRGQMLTSVGFYQAVDSFNARISVLKNAVISVKNLMRIRIHLHTMEVIGRIILFNSKNLQPGESDYAQIRLENKIYASYGDRFIFRRFSPLVTLGGGTVLETSPLKYHKRYIKEITGLLNGLENNTPSERILAGFSTVDIRPLNLKEIQIKTGSRSEETYQQLQQLIQTKQVQQFSLNKTDYFLSDSQLQQIHLLLANELEKYQRRYPGRSGMSPAELISLLGKKYSEEVIRLAIEQGIANKKFKLAGELISTVHFQSRVSSAEQELLEKIELCYRQADFNPPLTTEVLEKFELPEKKLRELITLLREKNRLIFMEEKIFFHTDIIKNLVRLMEKFFSDHQEINIAEFKKLTNTSRKYAIPLLTYLDGNGITERKGDTRIPGNKLKKSIV